MTTSRVSTHAWYRIPALDQGYSLRRALWVGLFLVAAAVRFVGADWDGGLAAHPDERFLLGVAAQQPLYSNVCLAVRDFPYGHLPVTVGRLVALTAPEADPLYAARLGMALLGVLLVAVTGACGAAVAGWQGGLVAGGVAAFAPFLIQSAHFYTVDPFAALFASAAVLAARRRHWGAAGGLVALAVASKASAAVVGVPLLMAAVLLAGQARTRRRRALRFGLGALATFAVVSPWSILTPAACWRGPLFQSLLVSGRYEAPYTLQYAGTLPYIYPLVQMAVWGIGPAGTVLGLIGVAQAGWWAWRQTCWRQMLAVGWTLGLFLSIGALYVKFPRYMLLLYPWWIAWAAYACRAPLPPHRLPCVRIRVGALVLLGLTTALLGLAQVSVYARPHPWIAASRWLYATLPSGSVITVEAWDHPLPVPLAVDDVFQFVQVTLPVFEEDGADKAAALAGARRDADAVILASRRGYGALARHPARYAETLSWYGALFATQPVSVFVRCPRIGPLAITDDPVRDAGLPVQDSLAQRCGTRYALRLPRLDESLRVYDAPSVFVFRR